jgi:predicted neuraminidase
MTFTILSRSFCPGLRSLLVMFAWLIAASTGGAAESSSSWRVIRDGFIEPAPEVAEVHASTIVEARSGALVASWFGGTKEGNDDVAIWVSRFEDGHWTPGRIVADGTQRDGKRHPTWNPVLHRSNDGRLILFFKVGPSPETWWGEAMESVDEGKTWSGRQKLPDGMLGPIKNKPVRLADGRLLCPTSVEYNAKHWAAKMEFTDDRLSKWSASADIADPRNLGAIQPAVLVHPDGRLQALARSNGRQLVQSWSKDQGATWSPIEPTGLMMANSGVDAVALASGGFLLVYNPSAPDANPKSWGERRPLVVSHSADGRAWRTVATLETKPNRQGYAYPAIIQAADGRIHVTYTWNRARIKHVILENR